MISSTAWIAITAGSTSLTSTSAAQRDDVRQAVALGSLLAAAIAVGDIHSNVRSKVPAGSPIHFLVFQLCALEVILRTISTMVSTDSAEQVYVLSKWQWHRTGSSWSPVRTLPVAPLWCDLGFVPNSRGNKAAANLRPSEAELGSEDHALQNRGT